jgi:teichuronic acid biosynthesis glycosyltransferase TuaC
MRVLVVTESFPSEGNHVGGIFILRQILALRELGHDITVLRVVPIAPPVGSRWQHYRALGSGYTYDGVPVSVARTLILPGLRNFEHLRAQTGGLMRRAIARFRPDVVHAHYVQPAGSIAAGRGLPAVITSHGIDAYDWPFRRRGLRADAVRTLELAEIVVGVSGFIADSLRRLCRRPIEVVFNGADARIFGSPDRRRAREALGIAPERAVLAYVGHLIRDKGIFELAAALGRLARPPLLLVAGDGESSKEFAQALREGGVETRFFGYVKPEMTATILAAADAATLPSYYEGLPVSVCEAMLSARPVVATAVGGIPEIIEDRRTGYLAPPHDVERLSSLYAEVFADRAAAAAIGLRAQEFARKHLTWEANARAYDRLYRQIARRRAA